MQEKEGSNQEKKNAEKEAATNAQITKTNIAAGNFIPPTTQISNEAHLKIYSCMIHTHLMNATEPGNSEKELQATLKENGLPVIKIPKVPDSAKLLSALSQMKKIGGVMETEDEEYQASKDLIEKEKVQCQERITRKQISSDDVKLDFYTKVSNDWPVVITLNQLTQGIQDGIYRFTYSESTIEPHEILGLIKKGEIKLQNCFKTVKDCIFRKIRTGQLIDRTPPSA